MTLTEYLNQSEALPKGSVEIDRSEINKYWEVTGGHNVSIKLRTDHFTYFVLGGNTILWTIDYHGNMKNQSVFKLKEPL